MLELLLFTYRDMFGEDFPLKEFEGKQEFEVINILYDCIQNNHPYQPDQTVEFRIMDAPGMKK